MAYSGNQYVGAPYNFVPVSDKICERYEKEAQLPKHNRILQQEDGEKRYSGEIQCRIEAKTDLFVGSGEKEGDYEIFAHDLNGVPCIPGSTIKGLVRSNMQVLSFGSIAGDVEDYSIMYRQVGQAQSKLAKYYSGNILDVNSVLLGKDKNGREMRTTVPKNVKAGYLKKENDKYIIYPTEVDAVNKERYGECNYYPLSELEIFRAREDAGKSGKRNPFSFFEEYKIQLQHENTSKSSDFKVIKKNGRVHVKGPESENYIPYMVPVYYQLKNERKVRTLIKAEGTCPEGFREGYVVSTGKMQEKKVMYVVPKISEKEEKAIEIPQKDVLSFKRDYENKKNKLHGTVKDDKLKEKIRAFFALPEGEEVKPVFYVEKGGRLYFGFTPFLRIFYHHTILDGLSAQQKKYMNEYGELKSVVLDYPSSVLGYSTEESSYKARVNFENFALENEEKTDWEHPRKVQYVMGEPKLSSYWDYLVQDNKEHAMTYNEDDFKLRGMKQYWLHEKAQEMTEEKDKKAATKFCPLDAGTSFCGTIRFKNLSEDELGLLLWCLSLETDSNQNLGRAKPLGYGRIDLQVEKLRLYDWEKMYASDALYVDVFNEKNAEDINNLIQSYKNYAKEHYLKNQDIMRQKGIAAFLKMKDAKHMPKEEHIRYMSLANRDYQNRKKPLHTVEQVCQEKEPYEIHEKFEKKSGGGNKNGYSGKKNNQNYDKSRKHQAAPKEKAETKYSDGGGSVGTGLGSLLSNLKLK